MMLRDHPKETCEICGEAEVAYGGVNGDTECGIMHGPFEFVLCCVPCALSNYDKADLLSRDVIADAIGVVLNKWGHIEECDR